MIRPSLSRRRFTFASMVQGTGVLDKEIYGALVERDYDSISVRTTSPE